MFLYPVMNANTAKQHRDNELSLFNLPIMLVMKNLRPETNTHADFAQWCAILKGELQNDIAWCSKRFANFTDYSNHHLYFSHMSDTTYILYTTVAIPVMSF
jgi:hypothetical protein